MSPAWSARGSPPASNSARAPKTWKINFPPLVVVSICSVRLLKPMPCLAAGDRLYKVGAIARDDRAPHDESVPRADVAERLLETWLVGLGATGGVGEQPFAAGLCQRILLQREGLIKVETREQQACSRLSHKSLDQE